MLELSRPVVVVYSVDSCYVFFISKQILVIQETLTTSDDSRFEKQDQKVIALIPFTCLIMIIRFEQIMQINKLRRVTRSEYRIDLRPFLAFFFPFLFFHFLPVID